MKIIEEVIQKEISEIQMNLSQISLSILIYIQFQLWYNLDDNNYLY